MTISPLPLPQPVPEGPTTFTARSIEDVLAVVPVVMGFHPSDSVVMLTFGADHTFHARCALPPPTDDLATRRAQLDDLAGSLLEPAERHGVRSVVLVLYSEDPRPAALAWRRLRRAFGDAGIRVVMAVRVGRGRYYPFLARDRSARASGIPFDIEAHPFLAQAVLDGRVVRASREELAATAAPDPVDQAVVAALVDASLRKQGVPSLVVELLAAGTWAETLAERCVTTGTKPSAKEVARLAWTMQATPVRDAVWGLVGRSSATAYVDLWLSVVRRTPDELVAAPAALLAWSAWMAGDGALAWIAVDRCREVDPAYGLAGLIAHALEKAVPPELAEMEFNWRASLTTG
jgi:hypothetical protein